MFKIYKQKNNKIAVLLFVTSFIFAFAFPVFSEQLGISPNPPYIGMPEYNVTDSNNINVVSGNLSYNLEDLKIGSGKHILNHSVHINSNDLANIRASKVGYKDKYDGGITIRFDEIPGDNHCTVGQNKIFEYIYVYDHESSYRFLLEKGSFKSLSDVKIKLDVYDKNTYVITKPDGTKVYFYSYKNIPATLDTGFRPEAIMSKIVSADGFEISIHRKVMHNGNLGQIKSVTSNNGLQLKYIYDSEKRPLAPNKVVTAELAEMQSYYGNEWFVNFPIKIIAINNAVETCPLLDDTCTLKRVWPQATYSWPGGMPAAMFIGNSEFELTDYRGVKTTFRHLAIDMCRDYEPVSMSAVGCIKNTKFYPHIVKVENNAGMEIDYQYKDTISSYDKYKVITGSCNNGRCSSYNIGANVTKSELGACRELQYTYGSTSTYKGVVNFHNSWEKLGEYRISVPFYIDAWDKRIYLAKNLSNEVNKIESKLDGGKSNYEYDSLGRLKTVEENGAYKRISYPYSYNGICSNFRFCHKPIYVSNFHEEKATNVHAIFYEYHPESGNISSITYPKDNQNKVLQREYKYKKLFARYLNVNNEVVESGSPIWLISSEFYCQNSILKDGVCSGNDKVTTSYYYGEGSGSNNLFLMGMITTSEADSASRTLCYKYDNYGNVIEQSQPKSGITDCNSGREF